MSKYTTPLLIDDTFRFSCSETVSCFNQCCRDLNQFLTPYDILRLKNRFGIPSDIFLEKYTSMHIGPESGLPVISLKMRYDSKYKCPFVTPSGCSVYEDRPSSCRMYPLVRILSKSRETGDIAEQYMLIKEPHCLGFNCGHAQTVREWIENQGVDTYNKMNDMLMDIISLKNRLISGSIDKKAQKIFSTACYDLDTFRNQIFEKGILKGLNINTSTLDAVKNDDVALLKLGMEWVKQAFFIYPGSLHSIHDKNTGKI